MVIFAIVMAVRRGNVERYLIEMSVLPILTNSNWFVSCYFLMYMAHPFLNKIINACEKKELMRLAIFMVWIYFVVNFFKGSYFASGIIDWVTIYFVVAYFKRFHASFNDSKKANLILLFAGIICNTAFIVLSNFIKLKWDAYPYGLMSWNSGCNPFLIMIAFASLNLARRLNFKSALVNAISGLSLVIYVIHENAILRTYYRPLVWREIYVRFGYTHVIGWAILMSIVLFLASVAVSYLYSVTARKGVRFLIDKLYFAFKNSKIYAFFWGSPPPAYSTRNLRLRQNFFFNRLLTARPAMSF